AGWREPWGADADHLKTTGDADACIDAGFVMYTIDPGDHVDDAAAGDPAEVLNDKLGRLPWGALETTLEDCRARHAGAGPGAGEEDFARAAVKYGRAVAHAAAVARHIAGRMAGGPFEIEISVDETATPTTPFEHRFVAAELARVGVTVDSLAVRYVGEFEKGVDYKGDLDVFRRETQAHAAVAREFGGYKLSVHSGSDKFSAYPVLAEAARGAVHLKTAGTSYLEAVRAVAECDIDLFREIAKVARARYDEDRATYHVSGETEDVPEAGSITLEVARSLLDRPGARQVFHVTYGSVLAAPAGSGGTLGEALKARLDENEELHWRTVARHITRHLAPFTAR
ncbi:MAG: tagaturonate epimerase family protein, partial [Planctomycetota bacterium]